MVISSGDLLGARGLHSDTASHTESLRGKAFAFPESCGWDGIGPPFAGRELIDNVLEDPRSLAEILPHPAPVDAAYARDPSGGGFCGNSSKKIKIHLKLTTSRSSTTTQCHPPDQIHHSRDL